MGFELDPQILLVWKITGDWGSNSLRENVGGGHRPTRNCSSGSPVYICIHTYV